MAAEPLTQRAARTWSVSGRQPRPRPELPRLRVLWLMTMVAVVATAVWGRLAYWQGVEHGSLSAEANAQHLTQIPLAPTRGMIYDRNGQPLAVNATVYDVTLAPDMVSAAERRRVADSLAAVVGVRSDQVMALL